MTRTPTECRGNMVVKMTFEVFLVTGSVLASLALVAILTAMIDGKRPRVAAIVVVIAGGCWSGRP